MHLIIETRFEYLSGRRPKLRVRLILEVLQSLTMARVTSEFWQWVIIGGVVVQPYFKGIEPLKLVKRVVYLIITLFQRCWNINRHQIKSISGGDIVFSVVFTCRRSEIRDPSMMSSKIFSTNHTFHSIITVNEVVLCKNSEYKKNYVSFPQPSDFARGPDLIAQSTCKPPVKS